MGRAGGGRHGSSAVPRENQGRRQAGLPFAQRHVMRTAAASPSHTTSSESFPNWCHCGDLQEEDPLPDLQEDEKANPSPGLRPSVTAQMPEPPPPHTPGTEGSAAGPAKCKRTEHQAPEATQATGKGRSKHPELAQRCACLAKESQMPISPHSATGKPHFLLTPGEGDARMPVLKGRNAVFPGLMKCFLPP